MKVNFKAGDEASVVLYHDELKFGSTAINSIVVPVHH